MARVLTNCSNNELAAHGDALGALDQGLREAAGVFRTSVADEDKPHDFFFLKGDCHPKTHQSDPDPLPTAICMHEMPVSAKGKYLKEFLYRVFQDVCSPNMAAMPASRRWPAIAHQLGEEGCPWTTGTPILYDNKG